MMFQIIPVIDILGGIVVHAQGGDRQHYPALKSELSTSVQPAAVIADLCAWWPFPRIYIADLDAIEQGSRSATDYRILCRQFPEIEFWLDCGIKQRSQVVAYQDIDNLRLVAGSETLDELGMLQQPDLAARLILSLDKKNNHCLGDPTLFSAPTLWTRSVILMNLDRVGSHEGPDLEWLLRQGEMCRETDWYLAGGIRNETDLIQAHQSGAAGALIASALHTGKLSRETIQKLTRR